MAGPWEDYQEPSRITAEESGPWSDFGGERADPLKQVIGARAKSGYEDVPISDDESLGWKDRLLRGAQRVDRFVSKPGMEMLSPGSIEEKKKALATAANTTTAGYLPNIIGGVKAAGGGDYVQERDKAQNYLDSVKGGTKAIGMGIGMLPALATGQFFSPAKTLGKRILQQGAIAGAQGFLANPGNTPGEINPLQLKERGMNAAISGAAGAGLTAAAGVPELAGRLKKSAQMRAIKQGGAMLKDFRGMNKMGLIDDADRMLLEPVELPGTKEKLQVVTPTASLQDVADRTERLKEAHGTAIKQAEDVLDSHFDRLKNSPAAGSLFDPHKVADRLEKEIIAPHAGTKMEDAVGDVAKEIERLRARPVGEPLTFDEARRIKKGIDQFVEYSKEGTPQKELLKRARGIINDEIEKAVDSVGQATGFPLYEKWKRSKEVFRFMEHMNEMANDKLLRNTANRFISPSDYGVGGAAGMMASGASHALGPAQVAIAGAAGGVNHLMRRYGNAVAATSANKLSNMLGNPAVEQMGNYLTSKIQGATMAGSQARAAHNNNASPETVISKLQNTEYAGALQQALQRGPDSYGTTFYMLHKDPNFRKALADAESEE